jgi:crotonobetainyl-CoA:carnitine CoA-transferase CaiB-like acyl-CoA transferase
VMAIRSIEDSSISDPEDSAQARAESIEPRAQPGGNSMQGVLEGIRVLDFGPYIAGTYCATLLADYGAEVIRIERVDGSEDRYLSPLGESGQGALFMQCARNKRGLTLNPMKPEGREVTRRLLQTADVVVANLPEKTLASMGLDYATLESIRPGIILTHITADGAGGPYSDRVGFDAIGQAMSGNMHLGGEPERPMKSAVSYVDFTTAILHAFGTVMAILERRQSGKDQVVSVSCWRVHSPFRTLHDRTSA